MRRGDVLEGQEADTQRPLDEGRPLLRVTLREGGRQGGVREDEAIHDNSLAVDPDGRAASGIAPGAGAPAGSGRAVGRESSRASMSRMLGPES